MFYFEIKKDIFEHLKECNASYLSRVSSGENITLLQDYPEECMHFVIRNIIHIINESIMMVIYAVYLWRIGLLWLYQHLSLLLLILNLRKEFVIMEKKKVKHIKRTWGGFWRRLTL